MGLLAPVLWANDTNAMLAAGITNSQTTIKLTSGQGAQFPSPSGGAFFPLTLISASNNNTREIAYCTARTADTLTVTRGRESTTALAFNAGDLALNLPTAGTLNGGALLNIQTFLSSGTYTPTTGMAFVIHEVLSGGGGGGGCPTTGSNQQAVAGGGQGGNWGRGVLTAAQIGASQVITVGGAGSGGAGSSNGFAGGNSSIGSLVVMPGGAPGNGGVPNSAGYTNGITSPTAPNGTNCYATGRFCLSGAVNLRWVQFRELSRWGRWGLCVCVLHGASGKHERGCCHVLWRRRWWCWAASERR